MLLCWLGGFPGLASSSPVGSWRIKGSHEGFGSERRQGVLEQVETGSSGMLRPFVKGLGSCARGRASGTRELAGLVLAKGLRVLPQVRTPGRSG